MKKFTLFNLFFFSLLFLHNISAQVFVSANSGNDTNGNGSIGKPYKTISKAVSVSSAGTTINIRAGVYRETVRPTKNNYSFIAYEGEKVIISGCDLISGGWANSSYNDNIKTIALGKEVIQVFIGEDRMNLARYPDEDVDQNMLSTSEWANTTTLASVNEGTGRAGVRFNNGLPTGPEPNWNGASYNGLNGHNIFSAAVGKVTSTNGNTLDVNDIGLLWRVNPAAPSAVGSGVGVLYDHINALTSPTEWYSADDGTFYFYPPSGVAVNNTDIDVRTRIWGIDLTDRTGITIEGINFFASSVLMENSTNCVLRDSHIEYPNTWSNFHHTGPVNDDGTVLWSGQDYGGFEDGSSGVHVTGSNNLVENCFIEKCWRTGVRIAGTDNTLKGSRVEDAGWMLRRNQPIQAFGIRAQILYNTVRTCPQSGIDGGNRLMGGNIGEQMTVRYNIIEQAALKLRDTGAFYINHQGGSSNGTEFAFNLIHDNTSNLPYGIYVDNGTSDLFLHHNLMNIPNTNNGIFMKGTFNLFSNNTVLGPNNNMVNQWTQGAAASSQIIRNNFGDKTIRSRGNAVISNNTVGLTSADFINEAIGDFRAFNGKGVDSGFQIPPYTDGFVGAAPDRGCYETGQPIWSAGSWVNAQITAASGTVKMDRPTDPIVITASSEGALADFTVVGGGIGVVPVTIGNVPAGTVPELRLIFNGEEKVLTGVEGEDMGANDFSYVLNQRIDGNNVNIKLKIQRNTTLFSTPWRIQVNGDDNGTPSAEGLVYFDTFANGVLANNPDIGGGMAVVGTSVEGSADTWNENGGNGQIAYTGTGGGNRASAYSLNVFNVSNGFTLEVDYAINSVATGANNQFSFGLVSDYTPAHQNSFIATNDNGIGFNLTRGATGNNGQGLVYSQADPSIHQVLKTFVTGTGAHTLNLTVLPDGNGGATFSYTYDEGAPVTGTIASFDFSKEYSFVAHARDGSIAKSIQAVSLSAPEAGLMATLYDGCNFNPALPSISIGVGEYPSMGAAGFTNNVVSSLKVPEGLRVTLYDKSNFTGDSISFTANDGCLVSDGFHNRTTSFKVELINAATNLSVTLPTTTIAANILMYPNPFTSELNVVMPSSLDASVSVSVELVDMQGRIVFSKQGLSANNSVRIDEVATLAAGIYVLQYRDDKGQILKTEKVVKQQ